jgi:protease I
MNRKLLVLAACGIAAMSLPLMASRAGNPDEEAIRKVVGYYFEGGTAGDSSVVARAFHKSAMMFYVRDTAFMQVPIFPEYLSRVAAPRPANAGPDRTRKEIVSIDIAGTAAVAKLRLTPPGAVLTDYMSLLKINGEWKIVNKIFDRKMGS